MIEETGSSLVSRAVIGIAHIGVVIPTCNASLHWAAIQKALEHEGLQGHQVLIVDSSSTDDTRDLARSAGYRVIRISKRSFRHGATRQMAADAMPLVDVLVYM